jgi:hypothetical protein
MRLLCLRLQLYYIVTTPFASPQLLVDRVLTVSTVGGNDDDRLPSLFVSICLRIYVHERLYVVYNVPVYL